MRLTITCGSQLRSQSAEPIQAMAGRVPLAQVEKLVNPKASIWSYQIAALQEKVVESEVIQSLIGFN